MMDDSACNDGDDGLGDEKSTKYLDEQRKKKKSFHFPYVQEYGAASI